MMSVDLHAGFNLPTKGIQQVLPPGYTVFTAIYTIHLQHGIEIQTTKDVIHSHAGLHTYCCKIRL